MGWWKALTEGFMRCRLVVERIQQRLDDVAAWLANAISPMLAGGGGLSGISFDGDDLCGHQTMDAEALCLVEATQEEAPYVLKFHNGSWRRVVVQDVERSRRGANG